MLHNKCKCVYFSWNHWEERNFTESVDFIQGFSLYCTVYELINKNNSYYHYIISVSILSLLLLYRTDGTKTSLDKQQLDAALL